MLPPLATMHQPPRAFLQLLLVTWAIGTSLPGQDTARHPFRAVETPEWHNPSYKEILRRRLYDAHVVRRDPWEYACLETALDFATRVAAAQAPATDARNRIAEARRLAEQARKDGLPAIASDYEQRAIELEADAANVSPLNTVIQVYQHIRNDTGTQHQSLRMLGGLLADTRAQERTELKTQLTTTQRILFEFRNRNPSGASQTGGTPQQPHDLPLPAHRIQDVEAAQKGVATAIAALETNDLETAQRTLDTLWHHVMSFAAPIAPPKASDSAIAMPKTPEEQQQLKKEIDASSETLARGSATLSLLEQERLQTRLSWLAITYYVATTAPTIIQNQEKVLTNLPPNSPEHTKLAQGVQRYSNWLRGDRQSFITWTGPFDLNGFVALKGSLACFFSDPFYTPLARLNDNLHSCHAHLTKLASKSPTARDKQELEEVARACRSIQALLSKNQLLEAKTQLDNWWNWVLTGIRPESLSPQDSPAPIAPTKAPPETIASEETWALAIDQRLLDACKNAQPAEDDLTTQLCLQSLRMLLASSATQNPPQPLTLTRPEAQRIAGKNRQNFAFLGFLLDASATSFGEDILACKANCQAMLTRFPHATERLSPFLTSMDEAAAKAGAGDNTAAQTLLDAQWQRIEQTVLAAYNPHAHDKQIAIRNPSWCNTDYDDELGKRQFSIALSGGSLLDIARLSQKRAYIREFLGMNANANKIEQLKRRLGQLQRLLERGKPVEAEIADIKRRLEEKQVLLPVSATSLMFPESFPIGYGANPQGDQKIAGPKVRDANTLAPTWLLCPANHPNLTDRIRYKITQIESSQSLRNTKDANTALADYRALLSLLYKGDYEAAQSILDKSAQAVFAMEP